MNSHRRFDQQMTILVTIVVIAIISLAIYLVYTFIINPSLQNPPPIQAQIETTEPVKSPTPEPTREPTEEPISPQPEKPPTEEKTKEPQVSPETTEEPPPTEALEDNPSTMEPTEELVTPDPGPSPEASESSTPSLPKAIIITSALNLRTGPGLIYEVIDSLPHGTVLVIQSRTENGDWIEVTIPNHDKTGWVSADPKLINFVDTDGGLPQNLYQFELCFL
jgi:hypothetical protein